MAAGARLSIVVTMLVLIPSLARGDVIHDWNRIMLTTIVGQSPFAQARFGAITQLAAFEAVNACTLRYEPYLGTVTAPFGASPSAAAITAIYGVLKHYFPANASLDAEYAVSLAQLADGPAKAAGILVGQEAAAAMIEARANDGASPAQTFTPPSDDPGVWQPTPPGFGPGLLLHWSNVTPFGIESSDQFRADPPPALSSRRYVKDYNEVKIAGDVNSVARPLHGTDVARFYAAAPPTQVWNLAAQQVSVAKRFSLSENARAFALLNMAISDALVSVFETKYRYVTWRPVTAIRAGDSDGNDRTEPDAAWTPLIPTPAFPGYASAHASGSGAARAIAERVFGVGRHDITLTHPGVPDLVLHYTHFRDITDDTDDARVYGGIHFRFDQEAGNVIGRDVGRYVYKRHLQPVKGRNGK
jgi:hypothetical protein